MDFRKDAVHFLDELMPVKLEELTPKDMEGRRGFDFRSDYERSLKVREYYLASIVRAIRDPRWIGMAIGSDEYNQAKFRGLPIPRFMEKEGVELLKQLATKTDKQLLEIAARMDRLEYYIEGQMQLNDLMVRAYQIMSEDYPDLNFFRGAEYDSKFGFRGLDFAVGNYPKSFIKSLNSVFDNPRIRPVLAMISIKDVVNEYSLGNLGFLSEGNWWRNSIELHFLKKESRRNVLVREMPRDSAKQNEILKAYERNLIRL